MRLEQQQHGGLPFSEGLDEPSVVNGDRSSLPLSAATPPPLLAALSGPIFLIPWPDP